MYTDLVGKQLQPRWNTPRQNQSGQRRKCSISSETAVWPESWEEGGGGGGGRENRENGIVHHEETGKVITHVKKSFRFWRVFLKL